jgi:FAD:protein FMN transferase
MRYGFLAFAIPTGVLSWAHACDAQTFLTEDQALRSLFGNSDITRQEKVINDTDRQALLKSAGLHFPESSFAFLVAEQDQKSLGYALVMNEIGKSEPITFMVAVSSEHRVVDILVMVFRESRGGEIREARFLRQFKGKKGSDALTVNRDIVNYSGATLSSKAIARGVKRALALVDHFYPVTKTAHVLQPAFMLPVLPVPGAPGVYRQVRYLMGTLCEIRVECNSSGHAGAAISAAFSEIRRLEKVFSAYDADSELSNVNRKASQQPVPLSEDMWTLTRSAIRYARATHGAVDVTVGALLQAPEWSPKPVGAEKISLDAAAHTVRFTADGLTMDFGGLAKGYAAARVADMLNRWEVSSALINLGGSSIVSTRGKRDWLVGVADPSSPQQYAAIIVAKPGTAVSCSGVYERSHIYDPLTGAALSGLRSAVAVTKSPLVGEVVSKQLLLRSTYRGGSHEYLRLFGSNERPTRIEWNLSKTVMFTRDLAPAFFLQRILKLGAKNA